MAPLNGSIPANAQRRPVVAIPLQFPRSQRQGRSESQLARKEAPTPAKSEKSDTTSGDERHTVKGGFEHPMTPESLPSSIHRPDGSVDASQEEGPLVSETASGLVEQPNGKHASSSLRVECPLTQQGATGHAVSTPPLEPQSTFQASLITDADTTNGTTAADGQVHEWTGHVKETKTGKPRTKSLRTLHEPPPEFHPSSEPSSTPLSGGQSTMRLSFFQPYSQFNGHGHPLPMAARPVSFNPEANFQPIDRHVDMSRTPSHTSSVDRSNAHDIQSPVLPRTPATFNDQKLLSALSLQDYVLSEFDNPALSDLVIDITALPDGSPQRQQQVSVHTMFLSRSPVLRQMIEKLSESDRTIRVKPSDKFMTDYGFLAALKYLYGAPLLTPDDFVQEMSQSPLDIEFNAPAARIMSRILDHVAGGYFLGIPEVVGAGLGCARLLQRWDAVPTCLAFALDGGVNQWWRLYANEEDESASSSSQEPTFGDASGQLLDSTLQWIAMALPINFQFNPMASQLRELPRLPTVVESRPSQADPRLSLIQFGEMSVEDSGRPDFLTTLISSILLSIPFVALKFVLEHPAFHQKFGRGSLQLAEAVAKERENRRSKVLQAKRLQNKALWEATKWQEHVQTTRMFPGYQLLRKRVAKGEPNLNA